MNLFFGIDNSLYKKIRDIAKANQRSTAAEIRFQLIQIYG